MKLFSIIKKNFKLLVRSKSSAFTVLIGPLLIILLVGLFFSGKSSYELSIGYYAPDYTNLTTSFIDSLQKSNYYVLEFEDEASCIRKIEQGVIHTCIIFPENFQISNEEKNELKFLVDYSRMNLVYKVIDSVSSILEAESEELSYSLTQILLSKIDTTLNDLSSHLILLNDVTPKINLLLLNLEKAKSNTEAMRLDMKDITLRNVETQTSSLNKTIGLIQEKGIELINESTAYLRIIIDECDYWDENESASVEGDFEELKNETLELYNETPERIDNLLNSIRSTSYSLSKLESDLNQSKMLNDDTKAKLDAAKNNLAVLQTDLLDLKKALERSKQNLEDISVTKAETIVSPVDLKIEPVVFETSKITFTFPFLLVLITMFIALLLSSSMIMFEKNSKAFFRNVTTPTRPALFVITVFITCFILILLQNLIILGLANFFLHIPLLKNAIVTLLIIFVSITFFIVVGMALGYLFTTQEGAIMASIVVGAVFMFLSNLVVPLESLSPLFSSIIKYNPYVLASELLRKSLLFKVDTKEALIIILILFAASLTIFALIIFLHTITSRRKIKEPLEVIEPAPIQEKAPVAQTESKGRGREASKEDLLKKVTDMTKTEFEENVNLRENKIADWIEKNTGDKKLAHKIRRTLSRKEIIQILTEDIKKEGKKDNTKEK